MPIWENQPKEFQESIANSISRWSKKERSEKRKEKLKNMSCSCS